MERLVGSGGRLDVWQLLEVQNARSEGTLAHRTLVQVMWFVGTSGELVTLKGTLGILGF